MHSTSLLGLLKAISYVPLSLMPSAKGLIFQNENFGFGLMSKKRLWSYSGGHMPPFLADQLTLSQPRAHILPTTLNKYPPFRFSDLPTVLSTHTTVLSR